MNNPISVHYVPLDQICDIRTMCLDFFNAFLCLRMGRFLPSCAPIGPQGIIKSLV
jgi:hypothetical protein